MNRQCVSDFSKTGSALFVLLLFLLPGLGEAQRRLIAVGLHRGFSRDQRWHSERDADLDRGRGHLEHAQPGAGTRDHAGDGAVGDQARNDGLRRRIRPGDRRHHQLDRQDRHQRVSRQFSLRRPESEVESGGPVSVGAAGRPDQQLRGVAGRAHFPRKGVVFRRSRRVDRQPARPIGERRGDRRQSELDAAHPQAQLPAQRSAPAGGDVDRFARRLDRRPFSHRRPQSPHGPSALRQGTDRELELRRYQLALPRCQGIRAQGSLSSHSQIPQGSGDTVPGLLRQSGRQQFPLPRSGAG